MDLNAKFIDGLAGRPVSCSEIGIRLKGENADKQAAVLLAFAADTSYGRAWAEHCRVIAKYLSDDERSVLLGALVPLVGHLRDPIPPDSPDDDIQF